MWIVGYTYEAAAHCPDCATERFGTSALYNGCTDREGNEVLPVHDIDEGVCELSCDDCRCWLVAA